jgi:hypothetical protein
MYTFCQDNLQTIMNGRQDGVGVGVGSVPTLQSWLNSLTNSRVRDIQDRVC